MTTPIEQNHKLEVSTDVFFENPERYHRLVGRLVYLAISRPELTYVVHVLVHFLQKPRLKHWHVALRVVRYLKSSPS